MPCDARPATSNIPQITDVFKHFTESSVRLLEAGRETLRPRRRWDANPPSGSAPQGGLVVPPAARPGGRSSRAPGPDSLPEEVRSAGAPPEAGCRAGAQGGDGPSDRPGRLRGRPAQA